MKAFKKMQKKAQKRSIHHNNAIAEFKKRTTNFNESDIMKAFKAPGSMNKKKIGAC